MKHHESYPHYWVNHLGFLLRKKLVQRFAVNGHDTTAEEWAVLLILSGEGGLTSTELSARSFRDKTTVTRMIDRLVKKGLVTRRENVSDRRAHQLELTEAGTTQFASLAEIADAMIAQSVAGIPEGNLATTVTTLTQIATNLRSNEERADDI